MTSFQELLQTQIIKKKTFKYGDGHYASLVILTEKKKKDKKKKRKDADDFNSEAIQ